MWIEQPNFWASGRLIALYIGGDAAIQTVLSSTLGNPITIKTLTAEGVPEVVRQVTEMVRVTSSIAFVEIEVISYEEVIWSNSCLELGLSNESCLQVETPGWLIILTQDGNETEIHVDSQGYMRTK